MKTHDHGTDDAPRNWGALVFACFMASVVALYAWSVVSEARRTTDWLLIAPGALIAVGAFLWAGLSDIRVKRRVSGLAVRAQSDTARPLILIALTCAYAGVAPFIGFDLATAAFIALCLLVQGERSWWKLAVASIGGAALMAWVFVDLLMVRLPVTLL